MEHRSHPEVVLRAYDSGDAAATLAVFLAAVTETASADYSPEQIRAWAAPERRDLASWDAAMRRRGGVVAVDTGTAGGGSVVGFSDVGFSEVGTEGHIDMLFVAPTHLRQGIAARLLAHVESVARAAGASALTADVSVTARPFFERHGFTVVAEQRPVRFGVTLTNHRMRRELRLLPAPPIAGVPGPARRAFAGGRDLGHDGGMSTGPTPAAPRRSPSPHPENRRDAGPDDQEDGRDETESERLDRNWAEILQELRVIQTGTQILTGFLLAIAFQPRFADLDAFQVDVYLVLVGTAVVATALGLAPVSLHRELFRRRAKHEIVHVANILLRTTLVAVGLVLVGTVLLVFDVTTSRPLALGIAGGLLALLIALWVVLPRVVHRRSVD